MPIVRMKTLACGPLGNWLPGQDYDIPGDTASALVKAGAAEFIKPQHERAILPAAETRQGPGAEAAVPEWPLRGTPQEYLQRYPDGAKAELAREIIRLRS